MIFYVINYLTAQVGVLIHYTGLCPVLTYFAPSALDETWETMEHGTTEIKNVEAIFFDNNETMEYGTTEHNDFERRRL